jgi:VanZ family protein
VFLPLLFALVWRPRRGNGVLANRQLLLAASLVSVGVLMEVLQALFAPTRSPELLDVVADAVGVGCALLVFGLARRTWPSPSRTSPA